MPPPPFEILEHTADVGLKAHGSMLPELFINAARGLVVLATGAAEPQRDRPTERLPIKVSGADLEDLLVNWLSEILYFMDAEGWEFTGFAVDHIESNPEGDTQLTGTASGSRALEERSGAVHVKAVTYHQISVSQTTTGWEAVVYFDI